MKLPWYMKVKETYVKDGAMYHEIVINKWVARLIFVKTLFCNVKFFIKLNF